jgi:hypothetical protein
VIASFDGRAASRAWTIAGPISGGLGGSPHCYHISNGQAPKCRVGSE